MFFRVDSVVFSLFIVLNVIAPLVNSAPAVQDIEKRDIVGDITGGAASVFGEVTSGAASVFEDLTSIAPGVLQSVTSIGDKAVTIITSEGGPAFTLAESGAGVATSFAGHEFTVATAAIASATSNHSNAALSSRLLPSGMPYAGLGSMMAGIFIGATWVLM
ncbi:hypothetical protein K435DRAFT_871660 [Dendrothele bispora CBS 962.96]|uniref:Uncharacterized protein n=1 Tax=Dendrothele bispora (strain CBS 962.96) TaxID=1314807 RepID=A0A4S8L3G0_DENBC|nr:hypothetical protein K435DRAFT_871660 [Dendrothele bispora CBS 962.96]